jgi:serine/threonine protein kinase
MDNAKAMLTAFAIPGFEIVRELGRGAMGVVYLSRQISLKRAVALKIIHHGSDPSCEKLARFRAEAEAVARLQHPHIVQIFEVGEHAGEAFIALEYVEGGSLAGRLREAPLDVAAAVALMATIARAVQHAHERDIVHRDLKPANILLTPAGVPKIADFGLAKFLGAVAAQRTKTGDILGTPTYMSPEQATGVRRIGPTTDVYALGAMLYELLTGQPPFSGKSSHEMLQKVIHESPIPLSKLSTGVRPELEAICLKCLVKEPSGRYPSAIALAEALERFQESPSDHGRGGLLEMARRKLRGYWPK